MKYPIRYTGLWAVVLGLCAAQSAWADLTMRHKIEFKFGSFLPPAAVDAMKGQLGDLLPTEMLVQIKGDKAYVSFSRIVMISDRAKGVVTLLDPKGKRFATSPMSEYADQIAAMQKERMPVLPPQVAEMFANIKFDAKTEKTGKTTTVQGISGEETLLTVSLEIPNPTGPGMQMRMEIHQWTAGPEEATRIPALRELAVYAELRKTGLDPVAMMTKSMTAFPGLADKVQGGLQEIMKNQGKAMLRMQTAVYMPSMANLIAGAADQPFTEYTMELAELSSAAVPESQFEVPADYQSTAMADLIGMLFPAVKLPGPAAPSSRPAAEAAPPPAPPGVYRVGNGVTAPGVVQRIEPTYTEEARAAKISGSVLLFVVVGEDGKARQMRVLRSLDPGLDQRAMEAVGTWTFKPGMKDGKPVPVQAQIEVNFRLL